MSILSRTRVTAGADGLEVEWEISGYLGLYSEANRRHEWLACDVFPFAGELWQFKTVCGRGEIDELGTAVYLSRDLCETECSVMLSAGFKKENGVVHDVLDIPELTFLRGELVRRFPFPYLWMRAFQHCRSEILPPDVLTLVFILRMEDHERPTRANNTEIQQTHAARFSNPVGFAFRTPDARPVVNINPKMGTLSTRIIDRGEVHLEIPNFLFGKNQDSGWLECDPFPHAGNSWLFAVLLRKVGSEELFTVHFGRDEGETECSVECTFGFKKKNGQIVDVLDRSNLTFQRNETYKMSVFLSFSRETLCRSELLPSGVLTVVCRLFPGGPATDTAATASTHRQTSSSEASPRQAETATQTESENCICVSSTLPVELSTCIQHLRAFSELACHKVGTIKSHTRITDRGGEVKEVELEIPGFLSLHQDGKEWLYCEPFPFARHSWSFGILSEKRKSTKIFIYRNGSETEECSVLWTFRFKKENEQVRDSMESLNVTFLRGEIYRYFDVPTLWREALEQRRSELQPTALLTLICTLWMENIALDKTAEIPLSCDARSSSVDSADRREVSTQTQSEICVERLSDDLSGLMLSGEESDFIVQVKAEEFRLHRCILGARTPVFRSMLSHEMKEKATGVVCIDDCEPDPFRAFVRYVYSGKVDGLSTGTVFGLYTLADKYQVDNLKSACLSFIQGTLSVETLCDVVNLSVTYGLGDLLERATDYFVENTSAIIQTEKWIRFSKDRPSEANELYLKAFKKKNFLETL